MPPLSSGERRALLGLARQAIVEAVVYDRIPDLPPHEGTISQIGAAFVTIRYDGELRGCVGRIDWNLPLGEVVAQCAIGAVTRDPRFPRMSPDEAEGIDIELSVLSKFQAITPEEIISGHHGLFVVRGGSRGLLLPQVAAERGWPTDRLLVESCQKAGLSPEAWRSEGTQIFGFTADVFRESDFPEK